MPLTQKLILGLILGGFITFPTVLFWAWFTTKGWRYPAVAKPAPVELDQDQGEPRRKAA